MITYVDTSALLKLVIAEPGSDRVEQIWYASDRLIAARLIRVEACAALAAARRQRRITRDQHDLASTNLMDLLAQMILIEVSESLIDMACEVAGRRSLRAYDAVHLAAALVAGSHVFSSADQALCEAALAEGLAVADPLED